MEKEIYQSDIQLKGEKAHKKIDNHTYSNKRKILQAIPIFSSNFKLIGNLDIFDIEKGELIERKKHVNKVYDGFVFQLYAQYYCLIEMGYEVKKLKIYSYDDNKNYPIKLPDEDVDMKIKFEKLINEINNFNPLDYVQTNKEKCKKCIYYNSCDRGC